LCVVPALAVVIVAGYFFVVPSTHHTSSTTVSSHGQRGVYRSRAGTNGIELGYDEKKLVVLSSRPGSPGHVAGLKEGDTILTVDGDDVNVIGARGAISKMFGPVPGESVKLQVQDGGGQGTRTLEVNVHALVGSLTVPQQIADAAVDEQIAASKTSSR